MTVRTSPQRKKSTAIRQTVAGAVDYPLVAILATLLALGLVMVYSASFVQAGSHFFVSQITWIALGTVGLIVLTLIPHRLVQAMAIPIMGVCLLSLVAVLLFGDDLYGARRTLFNGRFQPSEFAKVAMVIYVAAWVSSRKQQLREVKGGLVPFAILMGVIAGLIVLEHSFSVTIIVLITGITVFFVGGGDIKQLGLVAIIGAAVLFLLIWRSSYGQERVQDWWMALSDPDLAPYSVSQAMNILRKGAGIGTTAENWLEKGNVPLLWSDYLFANVGADLGFLGTVSVVVLFSALGYRGLTIALNAPDQFGALTAIGVTAWILVQASIHIGASLALIPATGIPLPFMSYGGSSMLSCMAGMGLLLSVSRSCPEKKSPYANLAFGWRNWWPRLSNSSGGLRAPADQRSKSQPPTRRKTGGQAKKPAQR